MKLQAEYSLDVTPLVRDLSDEDAERVRTYVLAKMETEARESGGEETQLVIDGNILRCRFKWPSPVEVSSA